MTFLDIYWVFIILAMFLASRHFSKKEGDGKFTSVIFSCVMWICISTLIVRSLFWELYLTEGSSMSPSLPSHSILILNKQIYKWSIPLGIKKLHASQPRKSEVIAFSSLTQTKKDEVWIKRVIGVSGDVLSFIPQRGWYLNGNFISPSSEKDMIWMQHFGFPRNNYLKSFYIEDITKQYNTNGFWSITIPTGYIFVLGDNNKTSVDSRQIGLVSVDDVLGRVDWHTSLSLSREY